MESTSSSGSDSRGVHRVLLSGEPFKNIVSEEFQSCRVETHCAKDRHLDKANFALDLHPAVAAIVSQDGLAWEDGMLPVKLSRSRRAAAEAKMIALGHPSLDPHVLAFRTDTELSYSIRRVGILFMKSFGARNAAIVAEVKFVTALRALISLAL